MRGVKLNLGDGVLKCEGFNETRVEDRKVNKFSMPRRCNLTMLNNKSVTPLSNYSELI